MMAAKVAYGRVFSGIQPSGRPHVGNYLGALKQWVRVQNEAKKSFFSIVDLHAITVPRNAQEIRDHVHDVACVLLACGVDPKKSTIFPQSRVMEHASLGWVLTCNTTLSSLRCLPHLKEKDVDVHPPMGLLSYPVLQAADILLYQTTHVPVGEDQVPHLNLARQLARSFNSRYEETIFVAPETVLEAACRVRDLRHPEKKMSKSSPLGNGCVYMDDSDEEIVRKIKAAVTDTKSDQIEYLPDERPGISNLMLLYSGFADISIQDAVDKYNGQMTSVVKRDVSELVVQTLGPIRNELVRLRNDRAYVDSVLRQGTEEAQQVASETWKNVCRVVGLS